MNPTLPTIARKLGEIGRDFYTRGWVLGTSGNFSAVLSRKPLRLAMTASSVSKGAIRPTDVLTVDADGAPVGRKTGRPSAETLLHVAVARTRGAGAVLHTHSVWSTMLSELHGAEGSLILAGFEMLKGLEGVRTHEHRERLPIFDNDQDMRRLSGRVDTMLKASPDVHGFLLRGHGLYTWGDDLAQARRHVEIFEFLLEVAGRMQTRGGYTTADVIDVTATTPNLDVMLAKFSREHWHDEDEVRFIVEGRGIFHIDPPGGPVFAIEVEAGDLISVPRGTLHWFDLCADRRIRAIRLFQDVSGWTPHYTDSGVDANFQPVCFGPGYIKETTRPTA